MTGSNRPSVAVLQLAEDSAVLEPSAGVEVRHVVTEQLMLRELTLGPGADLVLQEPAGEHVVLGVEGSVALAIDGRVEHVEPGRVAVVRAAPELRMSAGSQRVRCQVVSAPPDPALVRHLFHLEHEGHGFD